MRRRHSSMFEVAVAVLLSLLCCATFTNGERLVGLNGDSQNARYVEVRRSPAAFRRAADAPSFGALPKAHGIKQSPTSASSSSSGSRERVPIDDAPHAIRRAPPTTNFATGTANPSAGAGPLGLPSPLAPMMSGMSMPMFPMLPSHQHLQHATMAPMNLAPALPMAQMGAVSVSPSEIPTLSATLAPAFSLPTLFPTMSMPTLPPFTLPPSFDQMAAAYTKPTKKRGRKTRRKAPKRRPEVSQERHHADSEEATPPPKKKSRKNKTLPKVETRLPKYVSGDEGNAKPGAKDESWMVPYYATEEGKSSKHQPGS